MMLIKKKIVRSLVCLQLVAYAGFYYYGDQGLRQINQMKMANVGAGQRAAAVEQEIATYEHELAQWNDSAFYKEKMAREQLQMARSTDIVFYLTDTRASQYSNAAR